MNHFLLRCLLLACSTVVLPGAGRGQTLVGTAAGTNTVTELNLVLDQASQKAYILMSGPDDRWFAWGFGGTEMADLYTIVVDGNGTVKERKLGDHNAGNELAPFLTITSNSAINGRRYLALERPLVGTDNDYFSFSTQAGSVNTIWGVGNAASFARHARSGRGTTPITNQGIPRPALTAAAPPVQMGMIDLSITDLTVAITNHVEFTTSLSSPNWSNVVDLVYIPTNNARASYSTNVLAEIEHVTRGFIRVRH